MTRSTETNTTPVTPQRTLETFSSVLDEITEALDEMTLRLENLLPGRAWPDFSVQASQEDETRLSYLIGCAMDRTSRIKALTEAVIL